jgi:predicted phage terminase large subunit-like protein
LLSRFPDLPPKSVSFIPAKLSDNRILLAADPGYLANLLALPFVEKEHLLSGNWKIRPAAGLVFNKDWFPIDLVPPDRHGLVSVRYWDKASTPGAGDYTCGVKMSRTVAKAYYVEDVIRGQWSSLERNNVILATAQQDGFGTVIWIEQEPGSGGKESAEISVKQLAGYRVHIERVTGPKEARAGAFAVQCEARNVHLVMNRLRNWIPAYLDELHGFPDALHDDQVDASSGAFNKVAVCNAFVLPTMDRPGQQSEISKMPKGVFASDDPHWPQMGY